MEDGKVGRKGWASLYLSSSDRNIKGLLVQERTDKTRQDKTRHDTKRQDTTRQDTTRQDTKRHDKIRQDRTRQDRTGQDKTKQDKTRQDNRQWKAMWLNALSSAPQSEKCLFSCGLVGWLVSKKGEKQVKSRIRSIGKQDARGKVGDKATDCNGQTVSQRIATCNG